MRAAVFAFGDSIAHGWADFERGGWVNRLATHLYSQEAEHADWKVSCYNLGVRGDTTRDMLARLRREVEPRLGPPDRDNIFILACGTNDAAFVPAVGAHVVPLAEFGENLDAAIREATTFPRARVLLATIIPVVEELMGPVGANGETRLNRYVERYNDRINELAAAHGARVVDLYAAFSKTDYRRLMKDGLHPNAEGSALIFEQVRREISPSLGDTPRAG